MARGLGGGEALVGVGRCPRAVPQGYFWNRAVLRPEVLPLATPCAPSPLMLLRALSLSQGRCCGVTQS